MNEKRENASLSLKMTAGLMLAVSSVLSPAFAGDIHMEKQTDGVWIKEDDRKVFFYRTDGTTGPARRKGRNHYIHPLMAPDGKTVLTEDAPQDHIHHRGVFWAWHEVFVRGEKVADGWLLDDISWEVTSLSFDTDTNTLEIDVNWLTGEVREAVIAEHTRIHISPTVDGKQQIDFYIDMKALADGVSIAGSDDEKGYGGFSARLINTADMLFYSQGERVKPTKNQLKAGSSMTIAWSTGTLPQFRLTCGAQGKAIDQWIIRNNLSMQNCVWPGRPHVMLAQDKVTSINASITLSQN